MGHGQLSTQSFVILRCMLSCGCMTALSFQQVLAYFHVACSWFCRWSDDGVRQRAFGEPECREYCSWTNAIKTGHECSHRESMTQGMDMLKICRECCNHVSSSSLVAGIAPAILQGMFLARAASRSCRQSCSSWTMHRRKLQAYAESGGVQNTAAHAAGAWRCAQFQVASICSHHKIE